MPVVAFLFAHDAAIFLALSVLVGVGLVLRGPRTRERVVDRLLVAFLLLSGSARFLVLFLQDTVLPGMAGGAVEGAGAADTIARLALAELAIAALCLFALRPVVPVRIAVVTALAIVQLGAGIVWIVLALAGAGPGGWPRLDTVAAVLAGIYGLVLLAFDWANRTDEPDPLTPGDQRLTY